MSDITRDDLCFDLEGAPDCGHQSCLESRETTVRPVTDEEFDRLAIERAEQLGWFKPDATAELIAQRYMAKFPGKALRALLTDECEVCDGKGSFITASSRGPYETDEIRCPACGGRGWLPKDEVRQNAHIVMTEYLMDHGMGNYPIDVVSALADGVFHALLSDWLEAEDE